jgi:hypothetical protein
MTGDESMQSGVASSLRATRKAAPTPTLAHKGGGRFELRPIPTPAPSMEESRGGGERRRRAGES